MLKIALTEQGKKRILQVEGYWTDEPSEILTMYVYKGSSSHVSGAADEWIFYFLDGDELKVGDKIAGEFLVTKITRNPLN